MKKVVGIVGLTLLSIGLITLGSSVEAAPASGDKKVYQQPDGTTFEATQNGDEFSEYLSGEDGSVYELGEDGYWRYQVKPTNARMRTISETKVGINPKPENIVTEADMVEKNLGENERQNFNRTLLAQDRPKWNKQQNLLVMMVEFNDVKLSTTTQEWATKIFATDNRSLRNFYLEQTNQRIDITPAKSEGYVDNGVVKISLDQKHPDNRVGMGFDGGLLTVDLLKEASKTFDFSKYDTNKDNRIEQNELHVMVIVAGYERSVGNFGQGAWGHKGGINGESVINGIEFKDFTMFGERNLTKSTQIGVICHEFGHDLGLPDLYNTKGPGNGLGSFSVMGHGASASSVEFLGMYWGIKESGSLPVGLDAYSKMLLGLPVEEVDGQTYQEKKVHALEHDSDPTILKIPTQNSNEYFLIENRQLQGYDKGLASINYDMWTGNTLLSGGIAVYRVNTNYSMNVSNGQQLVTMLEADESIVGYSKLEKEEAFGQDSFYYNASNSVGKQQPTQINEKTIPSTKLANGTFLDTEIKILSEPSNEMSVQIGKYVPIEEIELSPNDQVLRVDERLQLQASIKPHNASNTNLVWSSSDKGIATVSETGLVAAKAQGTATITVQTEDGKKSATCTIKVEGSIKTYGTSPWAWNPTEQSVTFYGGKFPDSESVGRITRIVEGDQLLAGKKIKKIIFAEPVKAHANSRSLFEGLTELSSIEKIEQLDVSGVTNMRGMFYNLPAIKELDLSKWDTSNVTTMFDMFTGATALNKLNIATWNLEKVTSTERMFERVSKIEKLDLSNWKTKNITVMTYMFRGMTALNTLVLGEETVFSGKGHLDLPENSNELYDKSWVGPNGGENPTINYASSMEFVSNYDGSQPGTYTRKTLIDGTYGTSGYAWDDKNQTITFYAGEFPNAETTGRIKQIIEVNPVLKGKKIKKIIFKEPVKANVNSRSLFEGLTELSSIERIENLDVSNVVNMRGLFYNVSSIQELDLSNWNVNKVNTMFDMFTGTASLKKLNLSTWNTKNTTDMTRIFDRNNVLEELVLGENTLFKGNTYLAERNDSVYTGIWLGPNGTKFNSSVEFMKNYNGENAGVYVREKR